MADRKDIASSLTGATLTSSAVNFDYRPAAMMPEVRVLKIGGQSIMDRGRAAVFPLLEEVVAAKDRYAMLLCTGGGTRARHLYSLCTELEMPTGVLAPQEIMPFLLQRGIGLRS